MLESFFAILQGVDDQIIIRQSSNKDLELLEQFLPSPSLFNHHLDRFARQEKGQFTYLIAWLSNKPIGTIFINWEELKFKSVKGLLKDKPLIGGLFVKEDLRSKGIGTKLINKAEDVIKEKGYKYSSIAVGVKNPKAKKLYEKLGYTLIPGISSVRISWDIITSDGIKRKEYEVVNYLDKKL